MCNEAVAAVVDVCEVPISNGLKLAARGEANYKARIEEIVKKKNDQ